MKISQLSEIIRFPQKNPNGETIVVYASVAKAPNIPQGLVHEVFSVRDADDIKMMFSLYKPFLYLLPPATQLEWTVLTSAAQGYRVYNHPTTPRVAVECLRHKSFACKGLTRTYDSLWTAVEDLMK